MASRPPQVLCIEVTLTSPPNSLFNHNSRRLMSLRQNVHLWNCEGCSEGQDCTTQMSDLECQTNRIWMQTSAGKPATSAGLWQGTEANRGWGVTYKCVGTSFHIGRH